MTDTKENIDLKSIKVAPSLHRSIKAESVERDENIDATVARAWRLYKERAAILAASSGAFPSTDKPHSEPRQRGPARLQSPQVPQIMASIQNLVDAGREGEVRAILSLLQAMETYSGSAEGGSVTQPGPAGEGPRAGPESIVDAEARELEDIAREVEKIAGDRDPHRKRAGGRKRGK